MRFWRWWPRCWARCSRSWWLSALSLVISSRAASSRCERGSRRTQTARPGDGSPSPRCEPPPCHRTRSRCRPEPAAMPRTARHPRPQRCPRPGDGPRGTQTKAADRARRPSPCPVNAQCQPGAPDNAPPAPPEPIRRRRPSKTRHRSPPSPPAAPSQATSTASRPARAGRRKRCLSHAASNIADSNDTLQITRPRQPAMCPSATSTTPSDTLQRMVPSILPLDARSLWCQARISSDHAMNVSTVMLLCLSTRELGEVLLVAFGEVAVVVEAPFEC